MDLHPTHKKAEIMVSRRRIMWTHTLLNKEVSKKLPKRNDSLLFNILAMSIPTPVRSINPRFILALISECSFEPQGIGSSPNKDVTRTNSNIRWQKVSCNSSDINIENYILKITKPETDDDFEKLMKVEGTTSVNVTLSPCTIYSFQVATELRNGTGRYSTSIVFKTSSKGNYNDSFNIARFTLF